MVFIEEKSVNQIPMLYEKAQNYLQLDHNLIRIIRNLRTTTAIDVFDNRAFRFKFERIKIRHDRFSNFIARIYDEQTSRINKRVSK